MGHYENKKMVELAKRANEERYENHSRDTLKRNVGVKFKTTMIGALDKFEKMFGELWAHGIHEDDLTPEELEWRQRWDIVRTQVLNNGNNEQRAALAEIDQYTVKFNNYQYEFIVNKGDRDDRI